LRECTPEGVGGGTRSPLIVESLTRFQAQLQPEAGREGIIAASGSYNRREYNIDSGKEGPQSIALWTSISTPYVGRQSISLVR